MLINEIRGYTAAKLEDLGPARGHDDYHIGQLHSYHDIHQLTFHCHDHHQLKDELENRIEMLDEWIDEYDGGKFNGYYAVHKYIEKCENEQCTPI